jgi:hypothetical protein
MSEAGHPRHVRTRALLAAILLLAAGPVWAQSGPPSPEQVLGYGIGERFTDHASVVRYMTALADAAPANVRVQSYGETPEGRTLIQVVLARPDHMTRLDEVLDRNRRLADPATPAAEARQIAATNPAVVYFSYGVHGNESSSSEAAMWTAWDLARGGGEVAGVLDSVVVVIDPVVNPDGRDRYVNWYRQARGAVPNPSPEAREHFEPWPGGRVNHYMFDLNRDWAWATQPETRARLATWDRWTPQVHVDFHEMSYTSSYFFFPAARPINPLYPDHILAWGEYFGAANARAFDQHGWPYYTSEGFDLFYPGYGDSWPSLLGAIGMTYEQAGSGRAGLAIARPDGDTLTLTQRATQHRTSGNATLRASAARRGELLAGFAEFYQNIDADLDDVLIVPGQSARASALLELLERQSIRVERATRAFRTSAQPHAGYDARRDFPEGTLLVRARQPRGRLAITLLQPEIVLEGSFSYDISAWSLPFAYGVEAHTTRSVPDAGWAPVPAGTPLTANGGSGAPPPANAYGMLAEPGFAHWPIVVRYLREGGRVRVLDEAFTIEGRAWPAGTLFFPRFGVQDFATKVAAAGVHEIAVPVYGGRAQEGNDLGTEDAYDLRLPRVALLSGEGVSSGAMGAHWFFLEQTLRIPFDQLPVSRVGNANLGDYDVIIAADMGRGALGNGPTEALTNWIRSGGTLIATGSGARGPGAAIAEIELREDPEEPDSLRLERALLGTEEREAERWERQVPGAVLTVRLDAAHPLAFGAGISGDPTRLHVLHSGAQTFEPDPDFETVGSFEAGLERVSGVISSRNLERLERGGWLVHKRMGSGKAILFIDDPIFRHFWYAAFQPYANAILIGPAM